VKTLYLCRITGARSFVARDLVTTKMTTRAPSTIRPTRKGFQLSLSYHRR
jgi:hypothetical protein